MPPHPGKTPADGIEVPKDKDGECAGNDSRCKDRTRRECEGLAVEGADCAWETYDKTPTDGAEVTKDEDGECVGNDSRCKNMRQRECEGLGAEGADCEWEAYDNTKDSGACVGNDSRCSGSSHAACYRLETHSSDCRWKSSLWTSGPSGSCVGNDSRCAASTEEACKALTSEGTDCKWRGAFSVTGSMTLAVSDADTFVNNSDVKAAVTESVANFTGVPSAYVDVDLVRSEPDQRRLRSQQLDTPEFVVLTYAVAVGGGAPGAITTTGAEVGAKMKAASSGELTDVLSSSVEASVGEGFAFAVQETTAPTVVVADAASGEKGSQMDAASSGTGWIKSSIPLSVAALLMVEILMF